jgi:hypothetical protein
MKQSMILSINTGERQRVKGEKRGIHVMHRGLPAVVFERKCGPCAVRHNMLVENEISCTIPPPVPFGTECVTGNIVPFSLFYPHSVPNGTGRRTTTRIFY